MASHDDVLVRAVRHFCRDDGAFSGMQIEFGHDLSFAWSVCMLFAAPDRTFDSPRSYWTILGEHASLRLCAVSRRWYRLVGALDRTFCRCVFGAAEAVAGYEIAGTDVPACFDCRNRPVPGFVPRPLSDDSDQGGFGEGDHHVMVWW